MRQEVAMNKKLSAWQWGVLLATAIALLSFWTTHITGSDVVADASQNLWMALNLERNGEISLSEKPPLTPTMLREPLPALVGALAVRAVDGLLGPAAASEYFHGRRAELLKHQNILWLGLLSVAVFMIGRRLELSFLSALLCVLLTNALLLGDWFRLCMLNSLLTESAAAALLALGSWMLLEGMRSGRLKWFAIAGMCFGLLALVKAIFLYIALGLVLLIPGVALLQRRSAGPAARQALVMGAVAVLVVLPWMLRNQASIGYFDIAARGGEALNDRSVMDQMTRDEYLGSFYVWSPYPFGGVFRRAFGFSKTDINEGARLQRLNESSESGFAARDEAAELAGRPQDTFTYYRLGRARRVILVNQFAAAGNPQPWIAADRVLKQGALKTIAQHPFRHAALSIPFMWRGGYFAFPSLLIAIVYALKRRHQGLTMVVLPAFSLVLLYALTASFEPRYAFPMHPIAVCALVALAEQMVRWFRTKAVSSGQ
jgi:hypothetical protein